MPQYQHQEDDFLSLIHVVLKIRRDLVDTLPPGHQGFDVTEEAAIASVPDSLYLFLNLLLGAQKLLDSVDSDHNNQTHHTRVLSIAQDIV